MRRNGKIAASVGLATIAILSGCAGRPPQVAFVPEPVAPPAARPLPPQGATASMSVPPIGPDGRRMTPNRNLTHAEALWHVRMALNVAALACRDPADAPRLQYNRFLSVHRDALAQANAAVDAQYRARYGAKAIDVRDTRSTGIYNFFALPPAQPGFCAAAIAVGAEANALPSAQLTGYASAAIDRLDRPFNDFYDAYAGYQARLAAWSADPSAPAVRSIASAAPAPIQRGQVRLALDLSPSFFTSDTFVTTGRGKIAGRQLAAR